MRPSTGQGAYSNPADELQEPLDEFNGLDQARNMMMPSTSTPNNHVQPPNVGRGGGHAMVTRSSAARYLSDCLYLSLHPIIPFVSTLVHSKLI